MSLWDYLFDGDHPPQADIESLKGRSRRQQLAIARSSGRTTKRINELEDRVEELEEQVGALQRMNRALLATLRQSFDWSEEEFCELLKQTHMEDGVLYGKVTK